MNKQTNKYKTQEEQRHPVGPELLDSAPSLGNTTQRETSELFKHERTDEQDPKQGLLLALSTLERRNGTQTQPRLMKCAQDHRVKVLLQRDAKILSHVHVNILHPHEEMHTKL